MERECVIRTSMKLEKRLAEKILEMEETCKYIKSAFFISAASVFLTGFWIKFSGIQWRILQLFFAFFMAWICFVSSGLLEWYWGDGAKKIYYLKTKSAEKLLRRHCKATYVFRKDGLYFTYRKRSYYYSFDSIHFILFHGNSAHCVLLEKGEKIAGISWYDEDIGRVERALKPYVTCIKEHS